MTAVDSLTNQMSYANNSLGTNMQILMVLMITEPWFSLIASTFISFYYPCKKSGFGCEIRWAECRAYQGFDGLPFNKLNLIFFKYCNDSLKGPEDNGTTAIEHTVITFRH